MKQFYCKNRACYYSVQLVLSVGKIAYRFWSYASRCNIVDWWVLRYSAEFIQNEIFVYLCIHSIFFIILGTHSKCYVWLFSKSIKFDKSMVFLGCPLYAVGMFSRFWIDSFNIQVESLEIVASNSTLNIKNNEFNSKLFYLEINSISYTIYYLSRESTQHKNEINKYIFATSRLNQ